MRRDTTGLQPVVLQFPSYTPFPLVLQFATLNSYISLKVEAPPAEAWWCLKSQGLSVALKLNVLWQWHSLPAKRKTNFQSVWTTPSLQWKALGGAVRVENERNEVLITSQRCPLSAAVAEHPEICKLAETLLAEIIGSKVEEECDREGTPRCRFHVPDVGRLA